MERPNVCNFVKNQMCVDVKAIYFTKEKYKMMTELKNPLNAFSAVAA